MKLIEGACELFGAALALVGLYLTESARAS